MTIEWTNNLKIGIEVIDDQHREIVDYINKLEMIDPLDALAVSIAMEEMVEFVISHFSFEETMLHDAGFMFAVPHKLEHDKFISNINLYRDRHNKGEVISNELYQTLCVWLVRHIQRNDKDYASSIKGNMVKNINDKDEDNWFTRTVKVFSN
jgi:hemerythrin